MQRKAKGIFAQGQKRKRQASERQSSRHMKSSSTNLTAWGCLGFLILLGFFFFKWLPDMLWRAELPEIKINNYIFETKPQWSLDGTVIKSITLPKVYIRIYGKNAIDPRAGIKVLINGSEVHRNCAETSETYFCHQIDKPENGREYEVIAKNSAGETSTKFKVLVEPKTDSSKNSSSKSSSTSPSDSTSLDNANDNSNTNNQESNTHTNSNPANSCAHYEAGRCWDDLELEVYSNGIYDRQYGSYGTSFYYDDDCDQTCQDILEDAYDEGWHDHY